MIARRSRTALALAGLYLFGLGFLGGRLAERVRYDRQRAAVLTRYDQAARELRERMIHLEQRRLAPANGASQLTKEGLRP